MCPVAENHQRGGVGPVGDRRAGGRAGWGFRSANRQNTKPSRSSDRLADMSVGPTVNPLFWDANVKARVLIPAGLLTAVLVVYWRVAGFPFVAYDDDLYLLRNPHLND